MIFVQHIHPYQIEVLVCVGSRPQDILKWVKKKGTREAKKYYPDIIKQKEELFQTVHNEEKQGYALNFTYELNRTKEKRKYYFLLLSKYKDTWSYWECLIHELSHILDWTIEDCMLEKETEARAYLHEWLFSQIRRKIQGIDTF